MEFAKMAGAPFYETSAKTRVNIEESFYDLVREVRRIDGSPAISKPHRGGRKVRVCTLL